MLFSGLLWLTGLLSACNQDLFIDDFRTDVKEIQLEGTNATNTLQLKNGDWELVGDIYHSLRSVGSPFNYTTYNEFGDKVRINNIAFLATLGKVELRHPLIELDIEHSAPNALKIHVHENLLPNCVLQLSLRHKEADNLQQEISIHILPAHYEVSEVTYTLNAWGVDYREQEVNVLSVVTDYDSPQAYKLYPFEKECRKVQFKEMHYYQQATPFYLYFDPFYLFSEAVELPIPTPRTDGFGFELKGDKALFNGEQQILPLLTTNQEREVIVKGPGRIIVKKQTKYQTTQNQCVIRAHNVQNQKERIFKGVISQEIPMEVSYQTVNQSK